MSDQVNTIKEEQINKGNIIESNVAEKCKSIFRPCYERNCWKALPDVRDGLKPVQRRIILHAMFEGGMLPNLQTKNVQLLLEMFLKLPPTW